MPTRTAPLKRQIYPILAVLIALLAFALGVWNLDRPGLYYDEMLFVDGATGHEESYFRHLTVHGFPVLLLPYIGALKSWIFAPIFYYFGVNVYSVRIPSILIGISGALFLIRAIWRSYGPQIGLAASVLILLDPTLITHSKVDWGPNALMFLLRGILVWSLCNWQTSKNLSYLWIAIIAMGAGIFDKLSFIWLAFGALGASIICNRDLLVQSFSRNRRQCSILFGGVTLLLVAAVFRSIHLSQLTSPEGVSLPERLSIVLHLLTLILSGTGVFELVVGRDHLIYLTLLGFWSIGLAIALISWFKVGWKKQDEYFLFFSIFTLISFLGFAVTPSAIGPHHAAIISGLAQFILVRSLFLIPNYRSLAWGFIAIFGGALLVTNFRIITALQRPYSNKSFDPAISLASSYINTHLESEFIVVDWGLGTVLSGLSVNANTVKDRWMRFKTIESADEEIKMASSKTLFVLRATNTASFEDERLNFIKAAAGNGKTPAVVWSINGLDGSPAVEIMTLASS